MAHLFVLRPKKDFVKVGDTLAVKVIGVDYAGKIALAAKDYEQSKNRRKNGEYSKRRETGKRHG